MILGTGPVGDIYLTTEEHWHLVYEGSYSLQEYLGWSDDQYAAFVPEEIRDYVAQHHQAS